MQILVVDDDQAVRDSLKRSLQYSGYEVSAVSDGIEALAHLSSHRVDAVVMDVMMPRQDGLETTRMLRQQGNPYDMVVFEVKNRVGLDLGVTGVPETFVIDKKGVIRAKVSYPLDPQIWNEQLKPLIKQLEAE